VACKYCDIKQRLEHGTCRKCLKARGLDVCKKCGELKPRALSFSGQHKACKECRAVAKTKR
jgi:hypothetical protein